MKRISSRGLPAWPLIRSQASGPLDPFDIPTRGPYLYILPIELPDAPTTSVSGVGSFSTFDPGSGTNIGVYGGLTGSTTISSWALSTVKPGTAGSVSWSCGMTVDNYSLVPLGYHTYDLGIQPGFVACAKIGGVTSFDPSWILEPGGVGFTPYNFYCVSGGNTSFTDGLFATLYPAYAYIWRPSTQTIVGRLWDSGTFNAGTQFTDVFLNNATGKSNGNYIRWHSRTNLNSATSSFTVNSVQTGDYFCVEFANVAKSASGIWSYNKVNSGTVSLRVPYDGVNYTYPSANTASGAASDGAAVSSSFIYVKTQNFDVYNPIAA